MTALEKAKKMEALGDCTRRSAPTPSTRLLHSFTTPFVSPTIIRTRMTWMEMARMLKAARSGRAVRLPAIMRSGENFGSSSSAMSSVTWQASRGKLYHLYFVWVKEREEKIFNTESTEEEASRMWSTNSAEVQKKYFAYVKFSTQVLKTLCKRGGRTEITLRSSTE